VQTEAQKANPDIVTISSDPASPITAPSVIEISDPTVLATVEGETTTALKGKSGEKD
jgi:hypothetical protein